MNSIKSKLAVGFTGGLLIANNVMAAPIVLTDLDTPVDAVQTAITAVLAVVAGTIAFFMSVKLVKWATKK